VIYAVVIEGDDEHVKIGKTKGETWSVRALKGRLSGLQTASPRRMLCIGVAPGYTAEERELHDRFAEERVRREWFKRTERVNAWIGEHALEHPVACDTPTPKKRKARRRASVERAVAPAARPDLDAACGIGKHPPMSPGERERVERAKMAAKEKRRELESRPIDKPLTERQAQILGFINEHMSAAGRMPTMRAIGAAFGIRSTNGVNDHIRALRRKGALVDRQYGTLQADCGM